MDSIETMEEILKVDKETKDIFLSADASVMDEALRVGALVFMKKPSSIKDIDKAIQDIVKNPNIKIYGI